MTHCDRLLAVLSDGQYHDHHELYALRMIVHSRVANLRARGHRIEHVREGELHLYRLLDDRLAVVSPGEKTGPSHGSGSEPIIEQPLTPVAPAPPLPPSGGDTQLKLEVAA